MVKIRALDCLVLADPNGNRVEVKPGAELEVNEATADHFISRGAAEYAHLKAGRERTPWGGEIPRDAEGLRLDGPTLEEWTAAGYKAENYPPQDYAEKPSAGLTAYRRKQQRVAAPPLPPPVDEDSAPKADPKPAKAEGKFEEKTKPNAG